MKLPHAEKAVIDIAKLRDYLLSSSHPVGRFKAAFFQSLGYTVTRRGDLEAAFRELAAAGEAELDEATEHGQKYRVAGLISGPEGRTACVVTVWIVLHGQEEPRFVTAFPGESK